MKTFLILSGITAGIILGIGIVVGFGYGLKELNKLPVFQWTCGQKVVDFRLECKDGYGGCSTIYTLENGGKSIHISGDSKQDEEGRLCVRGKQLN